MSLIEQLRSMHPQAIPIAVALATGGIMHAWKEGWPQSFKSIPPKLKAFPATVISAAMAAGISATSGQVDLAHIVLDTLAGSFSGLMAVGGHETIARVKHGSKYNQARAKNQEFPVPSEIRRAKTGTFKSRVEDDSEQKEA